MDIPPFIFDINNVEKFNQKEIYTLLSDIERILEQEELLVYVPQGKTMIVGDLHGDYSTLMKIIDKFFKENFYSLIFLGDYVDRGAKAVEVVNILFQLKRFMPERITLLRGNHEDPFINRQYGFMDEIGLKFPNERGIFDRYNEVFSKLPLAAITWNDIFCVHGGVPEELEYIAEICDLPREKGKITHPISKQLVWNDPKERLNGFKKSSRGSGVKEFGGDVFQEFLERNEIQGVIRSHERFKNGHKEYFDDKLISLFSSCSYSKRVVTCIGVIDSDGKIDIVQI